MENELENQTFLQEEVNMLNEQDFVHFEYATQGQRFLNFLIDNLFMRFVLTYATGIVIGMLLNVIDPEFLGEVLYNPTNRFWSVLILSYLIAVLNYSLYYTLCEKAFKGRTIGKLITGTRAIQQDGSELSLKNALLRSLVRLVPFEIFSGFNTLTWHDSWTNTMVIKSR